VNPERGSVYAQDASRDAMCVNAALLSLLSNLLDSSELAQRNQETRLPPWRLC
jgi:hypothetical protein